LSLEWLRRASSSQVSEFLMAVVGLGGKSTGCVMLLALAKKEFPVDVNVARVACR
ncbi:hypothetical protein V8C86DRAFT_1761545, partial [Haematococcus lacustris]